MDVGVVVFMAATLLLAFTLQLASTSVFFPVDLLALESAVFLLFARFPVALLLI